MPIGKSNQVIAGLGTHHIAVQTQDFDESVAFYSEVMGMQKVVEWDGGGRRIALLDIGDGSHIELFEPVPGARPSAMRPAMSYFTSHWLPATSPTDSNGCARPAWKSQSS